MKRILFLDDESSRSLAPLSLFASEHAQFV